MSRYKWVWHPHNAQERLRNVGIEADGSLYNPNDYPPDLVRAAVLAANERVHEWRSQAAKQATETRRKRQQLKVLLIAKRIAARYSTGPRQSCYVCGRGLGDQASIARGIGSECWQDVLKQVEALMAPPQDLLSELPNRSTPVSP